MKKGKEPKIKLRKSQLVTKFYQFWYLSFTNFNKNNMWDSACSCSFGFVFSFVPIALIVLTILIGILKVSPNVLNYITLFAQDIEDVFDLKPLINNLVNLKSIRFVDIFLGIWVIWMARRLFLSIVRGMNSIFHSFSQRKGLLTQLFTFMSEFAMIFIFVIITMSAFTFNKMFSNSLLDNSLFSYFRKSFPALFRQRSNILFSSATYFLLFIFTLYFYRVVSGTNPRFRICTFYAACSTGAFFVVSILLNKFMNMGNYNVVYGTISTLIVLMMKVYTFFVIFLFCAQMVYVSQNFNNLLLAELYLLPNELDSGLNNTMRRKTFINSTVLQTEKNTAHYKSGDVIYKIGDEVTRVFYLRKGSITETTTSDFSDSADNFMFSKQYKQGSFFGELPVILNTNRETTAIALTDCEIMEIPASQFLDLIHENPRVSIQAISQLTKDSAN